jgi:short-subunit dehydrogenase
MESVRKYALITGASSGIGLELAKLFARNGYGLILVGRERTTLERVGRELSRTHGVPHRAIAKDLIRSGAAEEIFDEIIRASIHVDVMVNSAGVGTYSCFAESDLEAELAMMQLNMVSLTHLTKLCLNEMLARGEGKILNVASTAAFQPGPLMAVYFATKAYVLSFSEALANELNGSGITVSVLCPGPTHSRFQQRAGMQGSRLFHRGVMDAATVAAIGYRGLMRGTTIIVPGFVNRLLTFAVRIAPRRLVAGLVRILLEQPPTKSIA